MDYEVSEETKKRMSVKMTSSRLCGLCGQVLLEVRNTRQLNLCGNCESKRGLIKKYQNYNKHYLTDAERQRILATPVRSTGPFWSPKK